jgi:hypothetical protein
MQPHPDQAQALRLPEGVPALTILRLTLNQDDKPLALEDFQLPGDDLELAYPSDPAAPWLKLSLRLQGGSLALAARSPAHRRGCRSCLRPAPSPAAPVAQLKRAA